MSDDFNLIDDDIDDGEVDEPNGNLIDDTAADDAGDDNPLGPKGEKALQAEKQKRRDAQKELREWKALGLDPADIKKILDERNANGDDQPDPERIRQEAKAEAQAELMESRVLDKIEAKASRLFADPDDAAVLLMREHGAADFLDDGSIDVEAIQEALTDLLERKPYLAAQGGRRFQGSGDGGTRKESGPRQLTRDDLKTMSPEAIVQAKAEGRLANVLGGN